MQYHPSAFIIFVPEVDDSDHMELGRAYRPRLTEHENIILAYSLNLVMAGSSK